MEMVERVARAIREAEIAEGHCDSETTFASYLPAARAAIDSMWAPHAAAFCQDTEDVIWNRRIDAALTNGQSGKPEG
jgi:hypothetical protein